MDPAFGRTVATRVGDILLGRYKDPPRRFTLSLLRGTADVQAGQGYRVAWWNIQDEEGAPTNAPMQVTRFDPQAAQIGIEAEEQLFVQIDPEDLTNRTITIDANTYCFNLREAHDALYPLPATPGDGETLTVRCIIETGVTVGSNRLGVPAFDVGTWPSGIDIEIINRGRIQGRGGKGGNGHSQSSAGGADVVLPQNGEPGGLALLTSSVYADCYRQNGLAVEQLTLDPAPASPVSDGEARRKALWNRTIRDRVDSLLAEAGFAEDCSMRNFLSQMDFDALAAIPTAGDATNGQ